MSSSPSPLDPQHPCRLFTPLTVGDVTVRNRIWVSPMCQYSSENEDGMPTGWHSLHLGSFARGGAGLVMTEATAVTPEGRISNYDLGIWNDDQRDALAPIVDVIHEHGAAAGIQLGHAGRKGSTYRPWAPFADSLSAADGGWQTVAPSAIPFGNLVEPVELDATGVAAVVEHFRTAARRAVDAGFDVVEIHAAHGYLLHQFLSPVSNQRKDEHGGSLENRSRLLRDVVRAVAGEIGAGVGLFVRLSATDWLDEGGWDVQQTATLAAWLAHDGVDLFDISSGGSTPKPSIPVGPGYQVGLAATVRREAGVPVAAVGLITSGRQAESILCEDSADAIMVGREFLRDPHFALRAAGELGERVEYWPAQYRWARPKSR